MTGTELLLFAAAVYVLARVGSCLLRLVLIVGVVGLGYQVLAR